MKRMFILTTVCAVVIIGVGAQLAQATVPTAITEHIAEVTQWAYRGGDTNRYPLCGSTCTSLWSAEHAPSGRDPFATELWREMEKLRERIELLPLLGAVLGERALTSAQRIGVRIGGGTSRLMWLEVELPGAVPPTSIERGSEEPEEYVLNFHPAGATVGLVRLLKDAWVIGGRYGLGSVLTEAFQNDCGPGRGMVGYRPPVGGILMNEGGLTACAPSYMPPYVPAWIYALPSPVIAPSEDYTTQTDPTVVLYPYPQWDPGQSTVQEEITTQLETHADEYPVLIKWLDHHLGGRSPDPIDAQTVLEEFKPVYAFDSEEDFFPQDAGAFTNNAASLLPYVLEDANQLKVGGSNDLLAAAGSPNTTGLPPALTLSTLGATYGSGLGIPAERNDYIDARGSELSTYLEDAQAMRLQGFDRAVYGRVATELNDGSIWLQYWVFYYYNSYADAGIGLHEGDWEMVQIRLRTPDLYPDRMTFAAHDGAISCSWGEVETYGGSPERPVVYLGRGSHASYPFPGYSDIIVRGVTAGEDSHDGLGATETSVPLDLIDNSSWWDWPGRWGSSEEEPRSPQTPSWQGDKWLHPSTFDAEGRHEC